MCYRFLLCVLCLVTFGLCQEVPPAWSATPQGRDSGRNRPGPGPGPDAYQSQPVAFPPWLASREGYPLLFQRAGTPEDQPDIRQIQVDPNGGPVCPCGCEGPCSHAHYDLCDVGGGSTCGQDETNINIYGWLDNGFTWNPDSPANRFNGPVTFNDRANEYQMNQLYLVFEKPIHEGRRSWDLGGRVDVLYGTDYYFLQARGLETFSDGSQRWNSDQGPRGAGAALYGLALPQAYAEIYAPWGDGLSVKVGHFYTILGYESPMATENFFYSRSYLKQYAEPYTHTGALARYNLSPLVHLYGGFTRGWNNWEDTNGKLGFLGGLSFEAPDDSSTFAFTIHTGNEDESGENDRTVYSLVVSEKLTPCVTYVFQHDFGVQANAQLKGDGQLDDAIWYGITQYLMYTVSPTTDLGVRVEWFRDQDNARVLGVPVQSLVQGGNYVELTLGMNWRPSDSVRIRPELRWDRSDVSAPSLQANGMFDDFGDKDQITLALDMLFLF